MNVPEIALRLPRPLRSIHQIELSSQCNLRCVYCPHGTTTTLLGKEERPKMLMAQETFERTLVWVRHFLAKGNKEQALELNLAGLGESTLHPQLRDAVQTAHELLAPVGGHVTLTTNGLLFDDALARDLARLTGGSVRVYVSLHRPEKAGPAVEACRRHGILAGVSTDPSTSAVDWAGQVPWHVSTEPGTRPCPWIRAGQGYVFADGRISTCAFDASAKGVVGHVADDPAKGAVVGPYELCAKCDQEIGVSGYNQRARGALPIVE